MNNPFKKIACIGVMSFAASLIPQLAYAGLTLVGSSQGGFSPQTYTSVNLKTVDFATNTLANTLGVSQGTTTANGGSWGTATGSQASGFSGTFGKLASGTTSSAGAKTSISFTNGTGYVSFFWHLGTGDSDNTLVFNHSDGTSKTIANCGSNTTSCVGGYDTDGFLTSFFNLIFGNSGQVNETQAVRVVYTPPTGTKVTSISMTATRKQVCSLFIFCSYEARNFNIDGLSYDDNSAGVAASTLDHVEVISTSASGMTCGTNTFTVRACANASCSSLYTGGVTGTLKLSKDNGWLGTTNRTAAYTIANGSSVSGNLTVATDDAGTWVASATATATPAAAATHKCALGATTASASCNFTAKSLGIKMTLASHTAGTAAPLNVSVIKDSWGNCVSAVSAIGNLTMSTTATFTNAAGNTVVPTLTDSVGTVRNLTNGSAITGIVTTLTAAGNGSSTFKFNDVGNVKLTTTITGVSAVFSLLGLTNLVGEVVTTVAPAGFKLEPVISGVTSLTNPVVAAGSSNLKLKVSAINTAGGVTSNFGSETGLGSLSLTKTLIKPTAANAANNPGLSIGAITFANGVASIDVSWDEVGTIDLGASLTNYLGSGLNVVGTLTSNIVGSGIKFVPAKFNLAATPRCTSTVSGVTTAFTYAGQPVDVAVSALNASGIVTQNYDGTALAAADRVANAVAIAPVSGANSGAVTGSLAATAFDNGVGSGTIVYDMTNKLSAPDTVVLKATDTDTTTNQSAPSVVVRSGRIKLSNAFGSEQSTLEIPVQVQYWSGKSWVPANDACTVGNLLPLNALNRGNYKGHNGGVTTAWTTAASSLTLVNGVGKIVLAAPGKGKTGTVDVTLDLGPTGANLPWLKSLDASCGSNTVCNPSARATFGVYTPETQKTVNVRNVF